MVADNAARLAALLQVFEHGIGVIGDEVMESAARLAAWHLTEARRFFGELAIPPGTLAAIQLERWLKAHCRERGVTAVPRRDVQRFIVPGVAPAG
jgi:hypothetical protein